MRVGRVPRFAHGDMVAVYHEILARPGQSREVEFSMGFCCQYILAQVNGNKHHVPLYEIACRNLPQHMQRLMDSRLCLIPSAH